MKILPKISIIIPVYNVEEYIAECLQSVMRQTYTGAMECILVDDCGKDNSIAIAEQLIADYTGPIVFRILHHEHNRGLSAARNTGMDAATGDYIYYLDSDDWIDEETLDALYKAIISGNYVIAIGYAKINKDDLFKQEWIFEDSREINSNQFANRMLMQKSIFTAWGKLYRRDVIKDVKFSEGRLNEDTLYMMDLTPIIESNHYTCIELPLYSYHYRMRDESICHQSTYKMDIAYIENIQVAINRYRDRIELVEWLKNDQLSRCLKVLRDQEVDKKNYMVAAEYLRSYSSKFIYAKKPFLKTYIHILMIKKMPQIMWYIEH